MTHPSLALLLVLFLLIVMPAWGWLDMKRLKRDNAPAALTQTYLVTMGVVWLLAVLSALLVPARFLWTPPAGLLGRMRLDAVPVAATAGVAVGLLIGMIAPVIIVRRHPVSIDRQLAPIRFLLPTTTLQRWLFVLVCITAGIAEEWIYRGFVFHFLVAELPTLNGWLIAVAAAVLFGIAHAYQGKVGTVLTGLLGFIFSLLYIVTGSLLLPMAMHTVLDLRIFLLLPKSDARMTA
jgi:membrane protease YdiL (CAAX protease family)